MRKELRDSLGGLAQLALAALAFCVGIVFVGLVITGLAMGWMWAVDRLGR